MKRHTVMFMMTQDDGKIVRDEKKYKADSQENMYPEILDKFNQV
jgi:hypothetical protein